MGPRPTIAELQHELERERVANDRLRTRVTSIESDHAAFKRGVQFAITAFVQAGQPTRLGS